MPGQPDGPVAPTGSATSPSITAAIDGRYTALVPLNQDSHAESLWQCLGGEAPAHLWTYMFGGPYLDKQAWSEAMGSWTKPVAGGTLAYAVLSGPPSDPDAKPVGMMSFMNDVPDHRRIEIGSVILGEKLKQTRAATEAFYLMLNHAFGRGYARVEWKANNLNKPSLSAARRLGFTFEGIFRKHMILKGRYRDTAWFSITEDEWPTIKSSMEAWLSEDNFDENGRQITSLRDIRSKST